MSRLAQDILFGVSVGDALGVPVEFMSRASLKNKPVIDMIGYGTHNQPLGTWSDDSSLTFCLAEAIASGFSLELVARKFISWKNDAYWTAHNEVFDIGNTTHESILVLEQLISQSKFDELHFLKYNMNPYQNGNGALMRILPLLLMLEQTDAVSKFDQIRDVAALTHGHIRSALACTYYLQFAQLLHNGLDKIEAYEETNNVFAQFLLFKDIDINEVKHFNRLLNTNIVTTPVEEIQSSGYVIDTLEASIWCLLTTNNYKGCVLKAVNLGDDTDTTAAVAGGLAAILYGYENIPIDWRNQLERREDIENLAIRLSKHE